MLEFSWNCCSVRCRDVIDRFTAIHRVITFRVPWLGIKEAESLQRLYICTIAIQRELSTCSNSKLALLHSTSLNLDSSRWSKMLTLCLLLLLSKKKNGSRVFSNSHSRNTDQFHWHLLLLKRAETNSGF